MGLKTKAKDINVIVEPLTFTAELEIISGYNVQTFNRDIQEYVPDRRLVPCAIIPSISTSEPDGVMTGEQPVSGCEWYEGAPKEDGSNRIVNGPDYEISAEGLPTWSLKIKKNVDVDKPITIYAIFTFTDKRRDTEVRVERQMTFYTDTYATKVFRMQLDQPEGWVIDPLRIGEIGKNGEWFHTISAQLFCGSEKVDDAHAAYFWQVLDNGTWREISPEELAVGITAKDAEGHWTKTLTFDARFFRKVAFRCRGAYIYKERPSAPEDNAIQASTAIKVEYPKTLRVDIRQTAGAKVNAKMSTRVEYECFIYDNMKTVPVEKDFLFEIEWRTRSAKPGAEEKVIGIGKKISFVPGTLGFDASYSIAVYAVVRMLSVHAVVTSGGKPVVTQNKVITKPIFE